MSAGAEAKDHSVSEVAARGEAIYEKRLRQQVEIPENIGKLLLLDIQTERYEIGDDRIVLARRLRAKNPAATLYGLRIGYPAASAIGATLRPFNEMTEEEIAKLRRGAADEDIG